MSVAAGSDVCVVVRGCGERTETACRRRLAALLPAASIEQVSASEFTLVLRRSLEAGLAGARPWTLCVDADVLVLPDLLGLLEETRRVTPDTLVLVGLVADKLMLCRRPAGNHVYRTSLIEAALALVPRAARMRPETSMIQAMGAKGFTLHQSRRVVGVHDHGQHYADLYAKACLHAHKHARFVSLFEPAWHALAAGDDDFRVAAAALADTRGAPAPPSISRAATAAAGARAMQRLGLVEKPPFDAAEEAALTGVLPAPPPAVAVQARLLQREFDAAVFARVPVARRLLAPLRDLARSALRLWRVLAPVLRSSSAGSAR